MPLESLPSRGAVREGEASGQCESREVNSLRSQQRYYLRTWLGPGAAGRWPGSLLPSVGGQSGVPLGT